jgi:hypothetical protein
MTTSVQSLQQISSFFESYARALEGFDAKGMAYHYILPCIMMDDAGSVVFTEGSKLEGLFHQGVGFYRQYGIAHARPEVWSKRLWAEQIAKAKVNWRYYDAENRFLYTCDYHYVLHMDRQKAWKIQVAVSVNEKERMEAWLKDRG